MRKAISILLLIIYLLGATEFHQMMKIPRLVEHYQVFEKSNPGFGLCTFFRIHYLYPQNITDNDYDQDMQLPFKDADTHFMTMVANVIVPQPYYFIAPKSFSPEKDYPLHRASAYIHTRTQRIFQPPKA